MIINLTDEAAALLYMMVVKPFMVWPRDAWFKTESPTKENKVGSLHRWCEKNLIAPKDVNGSEPLKGGKRAMTSGMAELAQEHLDHYKKQKPIEGQKICPITDIYFADLRAALEGKPAPTADDGIDPKDLEALAKECTPAV